MENENKKQRHEFGGKIRCRKEGRNGQDVQYQDSNIGSGQPPKGRGEYGRGGVSRPRPLKAFADPLSFPETVNCGTLYGIEARNVLN